MRGVLVLLLLVLLAGSVSAFVTVDGWVFTETTFPGDIVDNSISLGIEDLPSDEDIRVVFSIPELGVYSSRGPFDPSGLQHSNVRRVLILPDDVEPGEYVVRLYVRDDEGNKRIRHRFIEIY
jgi:hypothetical protein